MPEAHGRPFSMPSARDAIGAGLGHIEAQVNGIESAVSENPGLAFDLAKTLVESVCRAVLDDRSIAYSTDDDLPRLFKIATSQLPMLPVGAEGDGEVRKSLVRTLNGLHTAVLGVCELRNKCGFASHGSGGNKPTLETEQAMLAAEAADAIIGFLHRAHRRDRTVPLVSEVDFAKNAGFNEAVDEEHGMIRIYDAEFRPSEVLFQMEPQSYRAYLAEFDSESGVGDAAAVNAASSEVTS